MKRNIEMEIVHQLDDLPMKEFLDTIRASFIMKSMPHQKGKYIQDEELIKKVQKLMGKI